MGYGLQVMDSSGNVAFDSSTRTFKFIAKFPFEPTKTKTITHELFKTEDVINIVSPHAIGGEAVTMTINRSTGVGTFKMNYVGQVGFGNLNGEFVIHQVIVGVY